MDGPRNRQKARSQRALWAALCLAAIAAMAARPHAALAGGGPQWTIGRAVIVAGRQGMSPVLYLKLSLRNVGVPGRTPVRIFGRWAPMQGTGRRLRPGGMPAQPAWQGPGPSVHQGQWSQAPAMPSAPAAHRVSPGNPSVVGGRPVGMRLLGRYVREVSLTNTAILEIPLPPARRRRGGQRLEIVVMSGPVLTDHQFIDESD